MIQLRPDPVYESTLVQLLGITRFGLESPEEGTSRAASLSNASRRGELLAGNKQKEQTYSCRTHVVVVSTVGIGRSLRHMVSMMCPIDGVGMMGPVGSMVAVASCAHPFPSRMVLPMTVVIATAALGSG